MKSCIFVVALIFSGMSAIAQVPALDKDTLLLQLEKTVAAVQSDVYKYKGEEMRRGVSKTYMFSFYGFRNGDFYSGSDDTRIEIGFGQDEVGEYMNSNLKEVVETYAKKNGFKINTKKVNLKNIKTKYTTMQVIDPAKNFPVLDLNIFDKGRGLTFYSGAIDPTVERYYGLVTCLTYQSGNAPSSAYSGVEYIYVYAKGNPNMSSEQIISYVQSNTLQQISRRSWQFLGKVSSDYVDKQKKLQRKYGKVVYEQTITIK